MTAKTDRRSLAPIVAIVVSVFAMALLLWVEGRLLFCSCGVFRVWSGDTCSASNSQQLFDPYSFTHVLHGVALFWLMALVARRIAPAWQLWLALTLEAAWEVFENTPFVIERYRAETAALGYTGDTIVNSFGDLACALVGFLVARQLGAVRAVIVFLVLEVILVIWIHDSLLLQLLMLIHPVQSIKSWQLCP
jgi:hypothetical protein